MRPIVGHVQGIIWWTWERCTNPGCLLLLEPLDGLFLGSFANLQQLGNAPHYHLSVSIVPRHFTVVAGTQLRILYRESAWILVFQWLQDNQKCLLLRPVGL